MKNTPMVRFVPTVKANVTPDGGFVASIGFRDDVEKTGSATIFECTTLDELYTHTRKLCEERGIADFCMHIRTAGVRVDDATSFFSKTPT